MKKKILFFSTSRADYTLIKNLFQIINFPRSVERRMIIIRSQKYEKILSKNENKKNIEYIKIKLFKITKKNFSKIISNFFTLFYIYLKKKKPTHIVLLGDRFEILSLAFAANFLNIKIFHFHGGEFSKGSLDDIWRDKISKLSDYHFVSHKTYKRNLIKLGINKKNIFNVGAVGAYMAYIHKEKKILINGYEKKILVTYHPATNDLLNSKKDLLELLSAIVSLKKYYFLVTFPGYDLDSSLIIKKISKLKKFKNIKVINETEKYHFYDYLKNFDLFIGNSSSGVIESASAKIPFLNIGNRQSGRLVSNNTFNISGNKNKIIKYINIILNKKNINYNNIYLKHNFVKNLNKNFLRLIK